MARFYSRDPESPNPWESRELNGLLRQEGWTRQYSDVCARFSLTAGRQTMVVVAGTPPGQDEALSGYVIWEHGHPVEGSYHHCKNNVWVQRFFYGRTRERMESFATRKRSLDRRRKNERIRRTELSHSV